MHNILYTLFLYPLENIFAHILGHYFFVVCAFAKFQCFHFVLFVKLYNFIWILLICTCSRFVFAQIQFYRLFNKMIYSIMLMLIDVIVCVWLSHTCPMHAHEHTCFIAIQNKKQLICVSEWMSDPKTTTKIKAKQKQKYLHLLSLTHALSCIHHRLLAHFTRYPTLAHIAYACSFAC